MLLGRGAGMLRFLFVDDAGFAVDDAAAVKNLGADAVDGRSTPRSTASTKLDDVDARPRSRRRCAASLVDGLGLKPRKAFGPVRVAVTGRRCRPPLFESMELLGRERSLGRLRAGFERARAVG